MITDDCTHDGEHCAPLKCLDCGRFSSHSWSTGWFGTENGSNQRWGGTCSAHGEWSESAA
jgi:hypothetical protein